MKSKNLYLIHFLILISCQYANNKNSKYSEFENKKDEMKTMKNDLENHNAGDFIKSYADNFTKGYNDFYTIENDTFVINKKNVTQFQQSLKFSENFTSNFIENFNSVIENGNKKNIENDETLNYDYFLITQEPEYYVEKILENKYEEIYQKDIIKFVFGKEDTLYYKLKKQKIDSIYR